MLVYSVTATLRDTESMSEFVTWLTSGHISAVLSGGAISGEIFRIDDDNLKIECFYKFPSREIFDDYVTHIAPTLRQEGKELFVDTGKVLKFERKIGTSLFSLP